MKTYGKYRLPLLGEKFIFTLLTYQLFLCHYWQFKHFFCLCLSCILCEENSYCAGLINIHPSQNYIFRVWFSSNAHLYTDLKKVGINCIIVCFQNCSGEALNFLSQPVRFHRGWLSVKTRQQHEVVGFYLPLNHSLKLLLLSAGGQR